ncbi:hypothetical protein CCACVL1_04822 [Corchorus capsularis]|uniref:Uncharacterized protein n=1 Tax=Corchorus capsularis TaxID=210143 RepID=A0A1R3JPT2_COCAP|nr:hypothetical protein CCACVL1_04822 [Corchorus capsularis]
MYIVTFPFHFSDKSNSFVDLNSKPETKKKIIIIIISMLVHSNPSVHFSPFRYQNMTEKEPYLHLSCVLTISLPKPNIRFKIPKALAKIMLRKNHVCSDSDDEESSKNKNKNKKKKQWRVKGNLKKKVGAMFCNVFGNNLNEGMQGKKGDEKGIKRSVVTSKWLRKVIKISNNWSEKEELCKKRILMGGKCKPLAAIRYDENGNLLPEM